MIIKSLNILMILFSAIKSEHSQKLPPVLFTMMLGKAQGLQDFSKNAWFTKHLILTWSPLYWVGQKVRSVFLNGH